MRLFMALIIVAAMLLSVVVYAKDYEIFDKGANYRGYVRDDDSSVTRFGRDNRIRDWVDKDTGARFDGHNEFRGWILDTEDDD